MVERFTYDADTGEIRRLTGTRQHKAGTVATTVSPSGRARLFINGRYFSAHRVVWQMAYGEAPTADIDHANGDPLDNRLCNLRLCDDSTNQANRKLTKLNSSGFKGVTWHKQCRRWQAAIKVHGKNHHLGLFDHPADAHSAYIAAARAYFGEFARSK